MLVPAILYKDQIVREFRKYYYSRDMFYENGCLHNWTPEIIDSPDSGKRQYAIVDKDNNLIGYLGFTIDWYSSNVYNFGLFSFDRGNPIIGKDLFTKMEELVNRFHRIEWRMIGGNPVEKHYDKFCKKYNGTKHVLKDAIRDADGNYRDDIIYEIVEDLQNVK